MSNRAKAWTADPGSWNERRYNRAVEHLSNAINAVELMTHDVIGEDRQILIDVLDDLKDIREDLKDVRRENSLHELATVLPTGTRGPAGPSRQG